MCTSLKYKNCFGRNYDYEESYNEEVRIIKKEELGFNYDIIGVCAGVVKDYPLLYDGMNEKGLCMSGQAFQGNAYYEDEDTVPYGDYIYPSWDFILGVLGAFESVSDVKEHLKKAHITNKQYSDEFPNSDLHWMISDKEESIIIEATRFGLNMYDNPHEVMTNNPPFWMMDSVIDNVLRNVGVYLTNVLFGDYTSVGRFERAAYLKNKMLKSDTPFDDVNETFHLLESVEQVYGATPINDSYEYTIYSVVYDLDSLNMYFRGYGDNGWSLIGGL